MKDKQRFARSAGFALFGVFAFGRVWFVTFVRFVVKTALVRRRNRA
jgi:hypothetical protein